MAESTKAYELHLRQEAIECLRRHHELAERTKHFREQFMAAQEERARRTATHRTNTTAESDEAASLAGPHKDASRPPRNLRISSASMAVSGAAQLRRGTRKPQRTPSAGLGQTRPSSMTQRGRPAQAGGAPRGRGRINRGGGTDDGASRAGRPRPLLDLKEQQDNQEDARQAPDTPTFSSPPDGSDRPLQHSTVVLCLPPRPPGASQVDAGAAEPREKALFAAPSFDRGSGDESDGAIWVVAMGAEREQQPEDEKKGGSALPFGSAKEDSSSLAKAARVAASLRPSASASDQWDARAPSESRVSAGVRSPPQQMGVDLEEPSFEAGSSSMHSDITSPHLKSATSRSQKEPEEERMARDDTAPSAPFAAPSPAAVQDQPKTPGNRRGATRMDESPPALPRIAAPPTEESVGEGDDGADMDDGASVQRSWTPISQRVPLRSLTLDEKLCELQGSIEALQLSHPPSPSKPPPPSPPPQGQVPPLPLSSIPKGTDSPSRTRPRSPPFEEIDPVGFSPPERDRPIPSHTNADPSPPPMLSSASVGLDERKGDTGPAPVPVADEQGEESAAAMLRASQDNEEATRGLEEENEKLKGLLVRSEGTLARYHSLSESLLGELTQELAQQEEYVREVREREEQGRAALEAVGSGGGLERVEAELASLRLQMQLQEQEREEIENRLREETEAREKWERGEAYLQGSLEASEKAREALQSDLSRTSLALEQVRQRRLSRRAASREAPLKELKVLMKGTALTKVTSKAPHRCREQFAWLQCDGDRREWRLCWRRDTAKPQTPSATRQQKHKSVSLSTVQALIFGLQANPCLWRVLPSAIPPYCAFSLLTPTRSYDFFTADEQTAEVWVLGTSKLLCTLSPYPHSSLAHASRHQFLLERASMKIDMAAGGSSRSFRRSLLLDAVRKAAAESPPASGLQQGERPPPTVASQEGGDAALDSPPVGRQWHTSVAVKTERPSPAPSASQSASGGVSDGHPSHGCGADLTPTASNVPFPEGGGGAKRQISGDGRRMEETLSSGSSREERGQGSRVAAAGKEKVHTLKTICLSVTVLLAVVWAWGFDTFIDMMGGTSSPKVWLVAHWHSPWLTIALVAFIFAAASVLILIYRAFLALLPLCPSIPIPPPKRIIGQSCPRRALRKATYDYRPEEEAFESGPSVVVVDGLTETDGATETNPDVDGNEHHASQGGGSRSARRRTGIGAMSASTGVAWRAATFVSGAVSAFFVAMAIRSAVLGVSSFHHGDDDWAGIFSSMSHLSTPTPLRCEPDSFYIWMHLVYAVGAAVPALVIDFALLYLCQQRAENRQQPPPRRYTFQLGLRGIFLDLLTPLVALLPSWGLLTWSCCCETENGGTVCLLAEVVNFVEPGRYYPLVNAAILCCLVLALWGCLCVAFSVINRKQPPPSPKSASHSARSAAPKPLKLPNGGKASAGKKYAATTASPSVVLREPELMEAARLASFGSASLTAADKGRPPRARGGKPLIPKPARAKKTTKRGGRGISLGWRCHPSLESRMKGGPQDHGTDIEQRGQWLLTAAVALGVGASVGLVVVEVCEIALPQVVVWTGWHGHEGGWVRVGFVGVLWALLAPINVFVITKLASG
ncbi:unnamed protein product [Vitrella brassicaformis CCMP3155]|uniref:PH domain-containing protein n=3 Tax=Vitrella brassicaformis TaxID=1169539 RepID=A0A0G4F2Z7_VITBC|nr:unnamed protein product [Vitrella brassicaformis CCMP3155]|eukprot:CEM06596.1 unnamed protein product [Vitrella brassicaformis CCMP3155]